MFPERSVSASIRDMLGGKRNDFLEARSGARSDEAAHFDLFGEPAEMVELLCSGKSPCCCEQKRSLMIVLHSRETLASGNRNEGRSWSILQEN